MNEYEPVAKAWGSYSFMFFTSEGIAGRVSGTNCVILSPNERPNATPITGLMSS
ncbi:UNVERIFIED_ORG: hypothetical protein ABIB19_003286 [Arthrobacter sp. UYEF10]